MTSRTLLFAALLACSAARATSDDAPIAYPGQPTDDPAPAPSGEMPVTHRKQSEHEQRERARSFASKDDPNLGLGVELMAGVMLLDSSRGAWCDTRFAEGGRLTLEVGRMVREVALRESLFVDVSYAHVAAHTGTSAVFDDTDYHDLTVAPAFGFQLAEDSPLAVYLQLGGGLAYELSTLNLGGVQTRISGAKPVLQYGLGLRGRPLLSDGGGGVRLGFRIELTRFRRGYMDDTLIAGGLGLVF